MTYEITAPPSLEATVALPSSKSISNRALIIHALTGGAVQPSNLSDCDDTAVMRAALGLMPPVIDIKAAGTAMQTYILLDDSQEVLLASGDLNGIFGKTEEELTAKKAEPNESGESGENSVTR